jgi:hypothetical protein
MMGAFCARGGVYVMSFNSQDWGGEQGGWGGLFALAVATCCGLSRTRKSARARPRESRAERRPGTGDARDTETRLDGSCHADAHGPFLTISHWTRVRHPRTVLCLTRAMYTSRCPAVRMNMNNIVEGHTAAYRAAQTRGLPRRTISPFAPTRAPCIST